MSSQRGDDNNVVSLRPQTRISSEGCEEKEQIVRAVARCVALSKLDYERARIKIAKGLKLRPSFLDKVVRNLSKSLWSWRYENWKATQLEGLPAGCPMYIGQELVFVLEAREHDDGSRDYICIKSDGNFAVTYGYKSGDDS